MAKLVVNNSQMQCSQGTDISAINISSQNIVAIAGEFVATEEDKISVGNIQVLEFANVVPRILLVFPCHKLGSKQQRKTVSMG